VPLCFKNSEIVFGHEVVEVYYNGINHYLRAEFVKIGEHPPEDISEDTI